MCLNAAHAAVQKTATSRTAVASARVQLNAAAFEAISADGMVAKGNVLTVAQLAGIAMRHHALK